ncbi:glycosyltransferase [uncultured Serinicoccus sp.]|uniref:glycosyltransferase n=1 Tax=uncultured Serinicoccus sp. TaxID=735514 RepID=UPI002617C0A6|nr:glycosyltransferase [uncultured Serinicoccus sp.]
MKRPTVDTRVTIVIPTLNEDRYLGALLRSLEAQVGLSTLPRVIVVDASPNDATREIAKKYNSNRLHIDVIETSVQDVGRQRNVGWQAVETPAVLFLDADTVLRPDAMAVLLAKDLGPRYVAAARHYADHPTLATQLLLWVIHGLMRLAVTVGVPVTNGDFIYTSLDTLEAVGGFAEGFALGEDTDFGLRARKVGARPFLLHGVAVQASSRRLDIISPVRLVRIWVTAFLRSWIIGPTPKDKVNYPFGLWGSDNSP